MTLSTLSTKQLEKIAVELLTRPGHTKVGGLVYRLLVDGLGASSEDISFEERLEIRSRTDALLGRTIFEFKSNLRREKKEAEEQLSRYLAECQRRTGDKWVGIATDGAKFVTYDLRDDELRELTSFVPSADNPREFLEQLESVVAVSEELPPDPDTVRRELGKESLAWHLAKRDLAEMWVVVGDDADVRLKRDLWASLLERVYGGSVDSDSLFFQHTYLTIVAKTMALHVLGLKMPEPAALLAGDSFREVGILGAVESDFFDWLLSSKEGAEFVRRVAAHAGRFRLHEVDVDVLKVLYESLIDPDQRHDLGEYYTPDWLAARMCDRAIEIPLQQRVLDPACGSGTFLFHAVRRYLKAAEDDGKQAAEALRGCCDRIHGIDVHPVAVQIARVTYLLALGQDLLRKRKGELSIPVYLGDSLQWNTHALMTARQVEIRVPGGKRSLSFPFQVAQDPGLFDSVISRMLASSEADAPADALTEWLSTFEVLNQSDVKALAATYEELRRLHKAGRDHIWGFVARNLVRPAWLSREDEKCDVIVGNPPWLSYRYMSRDMQEVFKKACRERGIWAGGKVATHQDLSAYFFARCVELYFPMTGVIAFVMPYAAMSRRQFEGLRKGVFGKHGKKSAAQISFVRFVEAWAFPEDVQPLFPVPSCVLIAERRTLGGTGPVLPESVDYASGKLPRRDATPEEADKALAWRQGPWPVVGDDEGGSEYRSAFRQGATMVPRVLCTVEEVSVGALGGNPSAPLVESRRTSQEKEPWKSLSSLRMNVEAEFLRPLYLGESLAPYRLLNPVKAVIPWDDKSGALLDAEGAGRHGRIHLAGWLAKAEGLWRKHRRSKLSFREQLDYYGKLSSQFPVAPIRVVYSKAGTLPAAALLRDANAIVDHKLYWADVRDEAEARYLLALLNSEAARLRVEHLQSRGQWGARDFDKVMFSLPIPRFASADDLHKRLAKAAAKAEGVAGAVTVEPGEYFVKVRQRIRDALKVDGVAAEIDELVEALLGSVATPA